MVLGFSDIMVLHCLILFKRIGLEIDVDDLSNKPWEEIYKELEYACSLFQRKLKKDK